MDSNKANIHVINKITCSMDTAEHQTGKAMYIMHTASMHLYLQGSRGQLGEGTTRGGLTSRVQIVMILAVELLRGGPGGDWKGKWAVPQDHLWWLRLNIKPQHEINSILQKHMPTI